jgi:type III restriction enzyme
MPQTLRDKINNYWEDGYITADVPDFIFQNLNPAFVLRPYQRESFARFIFYMEKYSKRIKPTQLLFHMATGSGKTLIMAGAILYLYEKGYRNFLFFVNSTNVIDKTRDNFLNVFSSKYLFSEKIKIGSKEIRVREVQNFQSINPDDVNISFTTIQGLHSRLNAPRENALTYEDFGDKKIVLISDEAHHINSLTKSKKELSQDELIESDTWEGTIRNISNASPENIMLEFTATVDLDNPAIQQKYEDKILYQYTLRKFREDGYSKEVKVLEADLDPMERALQAIVLSQYRRKVAEKHGVALKPVLLMKSRKISESKDFEEEFKKTIQELNHKKLKKKKQEASGIIQTAFSYFESQRISLEDLTAELRQDFDENRTLIVNSKDESEAKQLLVNSLEERGNEIRVIFTVNMLNEGWDVLNLFDIVRLYNTRDANTKKGTAGKTTISEAQLIGRGARYFPFQLEETQIRDQRKYDEDIENELRILETLYYHSAHNPEYIYELHKALVETGIAAPKSKIVTVKVKESFKKTDFWKNGIIYVNKRIRNERADIFGFGDIAFTQRHRYNLQTGYAHEALIMEDEKVKQEETATQSVKLSDFGENVIRTAIQRLEFYQFSNLKQYFPHLKSVHEFIASEKYLNAIMVDIVGVEEQIKSLSQDRKLRIAESILEKIDDEIQSGSFDYIGTKIFEPIAIQYRVKDKTLQISVNENGDQERGIGMRETTNGALYLDLLDKAWYVYDENYGTDQEKYFVRFVHGMMTKLQEKYSEIYLLRNEKLFKIHRFSDGAILEPDFALFLVEKKTNKSLVYQLFIEPKGKQLMGTDSWKQAVLLEIEKEYKLETVFENKEYRLVGLPFYNEMATKQDFQNKFEDILL